MKNKVKKKYSKNETPSGDIISLILRDHKPLKSLIKILKDGDKPMKAKYGAFKEFAPTLLVHAKAEEESLYMALKEEEELRMEGLEGDTEHAIAGQLIDEIKMVEGDEDLWCAKVKVLAELVEHHVEEEEDEFVKEIKKEFSAERRVQIGEEYSALLIEHAQEPENNAARGNYRKQLSHKSEGIRAGSQH